MAKRKTKVYVKKTGAYGSRGYKTAYSVLVDLPEKNCLGNWITEEDSFYETRKMAEREAATLREHIRKKGLPSYLRD